MASPTSPLPGVVRKLAPLGSFTSVGLSPGSLGRSPVVTTTGAFGSIGSVGSGGFNSGTLRVTPQDSRRRWSDYTPTELWPATPSPAGPITYSTFGVPMPGTAPASATVPAAATGMAPTAAAPMPAGVQMGMPMPGGVQMGMPMGMQQMPMQAMQGPAGQQMIIMQVPAGQNLPQGYYQMPVMPGQGMTQVVQPGGAAPQVVMMAPAVQVQPQQAEGLGMISEANIATSEAGRQLFNEAMDPTTLDGLNPDLPSRGSALHGTGRCSPCAWFWKARGCNSDKECSYCHMCPEGELKARKKAKVAAIRMGALEPAKANNMMAQHARGALKLNSLI
eukprot:gb/GFBE01014753.1/.p1 GENE.gb/GFBE01014753.1/~~gb/GFBE01014753.1/.p1  ORF type:complete len:333 (+),score=73.94 gb/GFBE01014753.1/:1-999(+)